MNKGMSNIGLDLQHAVALLQTGELVAIPTETVYGLAGNALNVHTVASIFDVKDRPTFDPLILHIANWQQADRWVQDIPAKASILAEKFMPGPLTLLLPKRSVIADLVTAGSPMVAIRVPAHPVAQALLNALDFPLAAPSANPFGYVSPTTAQHVAHQLGDKIPFILDGGPCEVGLESTIVGFEGDLPIVYRKGGVSIEAIEKVVGVVKVQEHSESNPAAPGMLKSHYAPGTPMVIGDLSTLAATYKGANVGVIVFKHTIPEVPIPQQIVLSPQGDYPEAARRLFAGLRYLDNLNLDIIIAELLPEIHLGRAINDRLRRASAKR